jgi:hypothetical protein
MVPPASGNQTSAICRPSSSLHQRPASQSSPDSLAAAWPAQSAKQTPNITFAFRMIASFGG